MIKKLLSSTLIAGFAVLAVPLSTFAHVTVKPGDVGVGKFQTFSVSVPNEKDTPTVKVRLVIPDELKHVTPTVKNGWKIDVQKTGEGEDAKVTEITWSEGSVPAGFRDDFTFSAQAPIKETTLKWKAYQTYQNGETVSWDQEPKQGDETVKPYSTTAVKNDVSTTSSETSHHGGTSSDSQTNAAIGVASLALLVSIGAFVVRKK